MITPKSIDEIPCLESMERIPQRPLGQLSDFVATEMPQVIKDNLAQLPTLADELAQGVKDTDLTRIGCHLDIMMLAGAIEKNGMALGPQLSELELELARQTGLPRILSYEDLIIGNPHDKDPRTYVNDVEGQAEVFFYRIHRVIEEILGSAVRELESGLIETDRLKEAVINEVLPGMKAVNDEMDRMCEELNGLHFMSFRHYFKPRPVDGEELPGASGKFSPGVLALDTLGFGNDSNLKDRIAEKHTELDFYPQCNLEESGIVGVSDIQRAQTYADQAITLLELATAMEDAELIEATTELAIEMKKFRNVHFKLVGKFLKDIITGTAGKVITPFLRGFLKPFQLLTK
ncbi:MAG: hypothetical protein ACI9QC_000822 [Oceanicoccus sp.]|jgi:hypothetical protein